MEMIHKVFDDVARDRNDFEESYMSLGGLPMAERSAPATSSKESKPDMATTSIQVHEASLMGLDRILGATQGKSGHSA